jgi:pyrroloquinoline quinone biosynthesis protein D
MAAVLTKHTAIRLAPAHRLQWENAQQAYVLLYPEGMVTLNASASSILKCCDGKSLEDILGDLRYTYPGANLEEDVREFLETARSEGWICYE